jgi:putative tryptophan/tyrosine transport system substrate-binding protein
MRRREVITLLAGAAAWPRAARAQQTDRVRRIGVFMNLAADDPEGQARNTAFVQALQQLGWTEGRNVRIDTRWGTDAGSTRKYAAELVALAPDVILASASVATSALQRRPDVLPGLIRSSPIGARLATSIASSRARSRPTFRCKRRPSTS